MVAGAVATGPQTADELASSLRFTTLKDYEDWLARLQSFPKRLDQITELMREGIKARVAVRQGARRAGTS